MALKASAALAALLLASASVALPGEGEGDNPDSQCLLSLPAKASGDQSGKGREAWEPLNQKYERLTKEVADLQGLLGRMESSAQQQSDPASPASEAACCAGMKTELAAKLDELEARLQELQRSPTPAPSPCKDKVASKWKAAIDGKEFKDECRHVDQINQKIKKEDLSWDDESECYGPGSVAVDALFDEAEYRCVGFCRTFGSEVGNTLAKQFCNHENTTLDNYWMDDTAYPKDTYFSTGTVVGECIAHQQKSCKDMLLAVVQSSECNRTMDTDFAQLLTLCGRIYHALNP